MRGEPGREAALRRPAQQLQQAGAARAQRQRRAHRQHQAQAQPAHRRESQKPNYDDQLVGGTELVRLQAVVGAARVRRRRDVARALRPYLATRHRALQQRGWQLRGDAGHEGDAQLHGARGVAPARHLQVLLRDRRRVLPLRPADMRHEVRLLDLRRLPGESAVCRLPSALPAPLIECASRYRWTCGTSTRRAAPMWWSWAWTSPSSTPPSSGTSSRCPPSGTRSSTRAATSRTSTSRSTSRCAARRSSTPSTSSSPAWASPSSPCSSSTCPPTAARRCRCPSPSCCR